MKIIIKITSCILRILTETNVLNCVFIILKSLKPQLCVLRPSLITNLSVLLKLSLQPEDWRMFSLEELLTFLGPVGKDFSITKMKLHN